MKHMREEEQTLELYQTTFGLRIFDVFQSRFERAFLFRQLRAALFSRAFLRNNFLAELLRNLWLLVREKVRRTHIIQLQGLRKEKGKVFFVLVSRPSGEEPDVGL